MNPSDIMTYREMCDAEQVHNLQRGMNYRLHPHYSVLLMSTRPNAPYSDAVQDEGKTLIYEGHDIPKSIEIADPKTHDQPMFTKLGKLTQNGLFFEAAQRFKAGERDAEIVRVYEKLKEGVWVYNGQFALVDAWQAFVAERKVFKFRLALLEHSTPDAAKALPYLAHTRMIPSAVKIAVWKRDRGCCVQCGSTTNLHYDHILPYSRGGTSLTEKNIQLLCMACNLKKSNRIE